MNQARPSGTSQDRHDEQQYTRSKDISTSAFPMSSSKYYNRRETFLGRGTLPRSWTSHKDDLSSQLATPDGSRNSIPTCCKSQPNCGPPGARRILALSERRLRLRLAAGDQ